MLVNFFFIKPLQEKPGLDFADKTGSQSQFCGEQLVPCRYRAVACELPDNKPGSLTLQTCTPYNRLLEPILIILSYNRLQ